MLGDKKNNENIKTGTLRKNIGVGILFASATSFFSLVGFLGLIHINERFFIGLSIASIIVVISLVIAWSITNSIHNSGHIGIEQIQAIEKLKISEKNYQELYDNALDFFASIDVETEVIINCNHALAKALGHSKEEILGSSLFEIYHSNYLNAAREAFQVFNETGEIREIEQQLKNIDGNPIDVIVNLSAVRNKDGKFVQCSAVWRDITERKKNERDLQQSRDQLSIFMSSATEAFTLFDEDFNYVLINEAALRLFPPGIKAEDIIGKNMLEVIPNLEDADTFFKMKTIKVGEGIGMIAEDISDVVEVQERLKENEELLEQTEKIAKIGGWEFDIETMASTWTKEVASIHELDPGEDAIIGLGQSLYKGESRTLFELAVQEAIIFGNEFDIELELVTVQGNHKWVRMLGQPIKEGSKVVRVGGALQDITLHKKTEQLLKENEERYRQLTEASPVGIFVHINGNFVFSNPAGADLMRISFPKEIIGKSVAEVIHPEDLDSSRERIQRMLNGEKDLFPAEERHIRYDGTEVIVEVMATPLSYQGKKAVQVIVTDISERKRTEDQLRRSQERLKMLAQKVVIAQEEERKRVSRELHDEAGQSLTALKIFISKFENQVNNLSDDADSTITFIYKSIDQTHDQLRSIAKGLRPPAIDTLGLMVAIENMCADVSSRSGIEIKFHGEELGDVTDIIKITLFRVVQEAISNILRHAEATNVEIKLQVVDQNIHLTISDDGKGFNVPSLEGQTYGLGINGMQERIALVNGVFRIQSSKGEGTKITVNCPRRVT